MNGTNRLDREITKKNIHSRFIRIGTEDHFTTGIQDLFLILKTASDAREDTVTLLISQSAYMLISF